MREDSNTNNDMPINKDYEPHTVDEMFFPDTEVDGDADVMDNPYEGERDQSNQDQMMNRNSISEYGSTGASDEYTAALDASAMQKKGPFANRGKVINMNVEGMPWYQEEVDERELQARRSVPELNGRETRRVIFSSLLAALMVSGVFALAGFLFILFCTKIWF